MKIAKRDRLAEAIEAVLPAALRDIDTALDAIEHGRVSEGVREITDALARLKVLLKIHQDERP